jgi:hypothetical protein
MVERWFRPRHHTGWRGDNAPSTRRAQLMRTTDHRMNLHDRRVQAARRAGALANVTRDRSTERKARTDSNYFYRLARRSR